MSCGSDARTDPTGPGGGGGGVDGGGGGGLVRTERNKENMKSRSQEQSLSDSRELDRSYDPLTGIHFIFSLKTCGRFTAVC